MSQWLMCCSKRRCLPTTLREVIKLENTYAQFLLHVTETSPVSCRNCSTIRTCLVARITTDSSYPDFLYKQLALTTVLHLHVRAALRALYHTPSSEIMTTSAKYKPECLQYVRFGLTCFEPWDHSIAQGHHVVQKKKKYTNRKLKACQRQTSSSIWAHCLFSMLLCLLSKHSSLASLSYLRRRLVTHFMLISPCIVNQFLKMFQQDDTFFVQYFIPCKQLYMFRGKHPSSGARINCSYSIWK
jgi:hypothetical protein